MENISMKDLLEAQEKELSSIKVGEVIESTILKITKDEVVVDVKYGFDGIVPKEELNLEKGKSIEEYYNVGDKIKAVITKINQKDAIITLSKVKLDKKEDTKEIESLFNEKRIITALVHKNIEKGVFAKYKSIEIFIPISLLDVKFVKDTKDYLDKNLELYIVEFDKSKNKIVGSHRQVLQERIDKEKEERRIRIEEEKKERLRKKKEEKEAKIAKEKKEKEDLFNSLEVGKRLEGRVTNIVDYGAFVDIGGIEGLLHKNNMSWEKVNDISEFVSKGKEVSVYVLNIDKENKKFSVALKDINNDPWEKIKEEVSLNSLVSGEVVRIIEKGAFIRIKEGIEAFLPISELSEERVFKVANVLNIGDIINVLVIEFNPKNRRMVVSLKEANKEPEEDYSEYLEVNESLGSLGDLFKDKFKNLKR